MSAMTRVVFKYPLEAVTVIDVPPRARVVRVGMDASRPCVWLEHYHPVSDDLKEQRTFHLFVTGEPFDENFEHVGSFAAQKGSFIGHVYEAISVQGN